jgi:Secretion system C-terminal sorting domain
MALGENIGYGLPLTQNTATNYIQDTCFGGRLTHITLMGDLTLRMHIVTPPGGNLSFSENGGDVTVSWTASADADLGYHVFRKEVGAAFFERLTETPVNELSYTIECVDPDIEYVYMVRALRLENSASGSYYNLSQGVKDNYTLQVACISALSDIENVSVDISPIPTDDLLHIKLSAPTVADFQLELRNINGQAVLHENIRAQQIHTLSTAHLPAGMYLLVIRNESGELVSRKVSVFR